MPWLLGRSCWIFSQIESNRFGSLEKMFKIKNPIELNNLDKIVDDLVDKYDDNLKKYIAADHEPISSEACAKIEQEWIDELNTKYDEKAHKSTGRKVPHDWRKGSK
jgi:hypothetical protein